MNGVPPVRLRLFPLCLVALLVALGGCATSNTRPDPEEIVSTQSAPSMTQAEKVLTSGARDEGPISLSGGKKDASANTPKPEIDKGSAVFLNEAAARAPVVTPPDGEGQLTFNFENQPIQAVAKAILGDLLQLNYVIAPGVQGNVSFSTSKPIKSEQAMSILEMLLSWTNNSLVFNEGRYTVLPTKDALPGKLVPRIAPPSAAKGYEVRVFPLRFVSPKEMEKLLKPYAKPDAFISVDTARSMLVLAGTATELVNYQRTIDTFDVDWLKGMSIGVYAVVNVEVAKIMPELDKLFGATGESPMAGMFRFVPIERTNSVIVITPNPDYLAQAEEWLRRLDQGGSENGTQLYVYDVKNVKSIDLADRLNEVFTGQRGSGGSSSRRTSSRGGVAPGLQSVEVRGNNDSSRRAEAAREKQAAANTAGTGGAQAFTIGDDESEVRITAVEENNQILVMGTQSQWGIIQSAIRRLDVEPLQVQIETKILEVILAGKLEYGLKWYLEGLIGTTNGNDGGTSNRFTNSQPGNQQRGLFGSQTKPGADGQNFFYSFINSEIEVAINALQSDGTTKTLSAPSLVVLNNKEARINVGQQLPVVQNYLSGGFNTGTNGVNTGTSYGSVQFRDVGVILTVTPRVNPGGLVYMEVQQEVSNPGTQDPTGNYSVNKREIETEIAVQSGQTILLGGLINESEINSKNGVPGLSRIPILGNLFGSTKRQRDRTELIVLITPRVIGNQSDAGDITKEYQRRFESLPPLKGQGADTLESVFGDPEKKKKPKP
ncbi:type II secretion system protein D (GspD) [Tahibacter aquaticus]|uniref:Type II secretion system protein D (GspD) n=1 Tax=Tahibacter aquaticus TaxID=520092 RepID=A0A4R6ZAC2_9GAMM|nr:type II secretion system protein D (GspD) [Tahibacter aquaticus]